MKKITQLLTPVILITLTIGFFSCKKGSDLNTDNYLLGSQLGAVAIASTNSVSGMATTSGADSVYAMNACHKDHSRTSVAAASLPAGITTYLTTNYSGYTFIKAFSTTLISTGTVDGYVVGVMFNGKPVALKFDANGNFVNVLELREGRDMEKPGGHHDGGCFDNRDGKQRDSLALTALSTVIKQYFTANYSQDTLKGAWTNKDGSIIVISKNMKFYATAFKADGTFIKREELPARSGKDKEVAQAALPASTLAYLNTTYPNYVFKKAFADVDNGALKGYLVIIDANLTKYAVQFDASGNFVAVKIIR